MSQMADQSKAGELLAGHYQKTFELTYELWKERNRLFPTLAAVIGGGVLLAFKIPEANSLLIALVGGLLNLDTSTQARLQQSFPFEILQTVLLVVVFHMMLDLYRHTLDIDRSYKYLAGLEAEIRQSLGLADGSVAFTREDRFYQQHHPQVLSGGIRWVYNLVLFALLAIFLYARISDDIQRGNAVFIIANIAISLPIILYFVAYAFPGIMRAKKS